MRELGGRLRATICLIVLPIALMVASVRAVLRSRRGPLRGVDDIYIGFARLCLRVSGTRVQAFGLDHLDPSRAYVIVPNHESNLDPMALLSTLDMLSIRFVVKREITRIPIFGPALLRTGNVRVDRSNPSKDITRLREGMGRRDPAVSILFYAQGTRARDGSFQRFKKGAFATAVTEKLAILPIATAGTYPLWRPGSPFLRGGTVVLEVGAPISVEGMDLEDREALRAHTETIVYELRAKARQRLRDAGIDPGSVD